MALDPRPASRKHQRVCPAAQLEGGVAARKIRPPTAPRKERSSRRTLIHYQKKPTTAPNGGPRSARGK
jgi:hypothetical protein